MPLKVIAKGWFLVLIFLATFCSLLRGQEPNKNTNAVNLRKPGVSAGPSGHAPLAPGALAANPDLSLIEYANLTLNQLAFAKFQFPTLDKEDLVEKFRNLVTELREDHSARLALNKRGFSPEVLQKLWRMNREIGIVAKLLELSGSDVQKEGQKARKESILANSASLEKSIRPKLNNEELTKVAETLQANLEVMKIHLRALKHPLSGKDAETVAIYLKALEDLQLFNEGGSLKTEKFFLKDLLEMNAKAEKVLGPLVKDSRVFQDEILKDGFRLIGSQLSDALKD